MAVSRVRRRLVLALPAVLVAVVAALTADGSDKQRVRPQTPPASPQTRPRPPQSSPVPSPRAAPTIVSPETEAAHARAREFLTEYLALLHGRGSMPVLRHAAARELRRDLRRNRPRVTPRQQQTGSRIHLSAEFRSSASARALAVMKERGGPPYTLELYLERRGSRWVVTRIGDA